MYICVSVDGVKSVFAYSVRAVFFLTRPSADEATQRPALPNGFVMQSAGAKAAFLPHHHPCFSFPQVGVNRRQDELSGLFPCPHFIERDSIINEQQVVCVFVVLLSIPHVSL